MSEEKLTMAERVRLAKARVAAEGGPKIPEAPKPVSNLYTQDETKLVSDDTAAKAKQAGKFAALAGKALLEKGREAGELAAIKAKAAMAEREARKLEEARLTREANEQAQREALAASQAAALAIQDPVQAIVEPAPSPWPTLTAEPVIRPEQAEQVEDEPEVEMVAPELDRASAEDFAYAEDPAREEVAPVLEVVPLPDPVIALAPRPVIRPVVRPAPTPVPEAWKTEEGKPARSRLPLIVGGVVLVGAIAGGAFWFTQRGSEPSAIATPTQVASPVVAPSPLPPVIEQALPVVAPMQPDMSAPVPEVVREPAAAYGMDEPVAEKVQAVEKSVVKQPEPRVEPTPEPAPVKKAPVVAPSKPKPKPVATPKVQPEPSSLDKGIEDLEALEKQLGG